MKQLPSLQSWAVSPKMACEQWYRNDSQMLHGVTSWGINGERNTHGKYTQLWEVPNVPTQCHGDGRDGMCSNMGVPKFPLSSIIRGVLLSVRQTDPTSLNPWVTHHPFSSSPKQIRNLPIEPPATHQQSKAATLPNQNTNMLLTVNQGSRYPLYYISMPSMYPTPLPQRPLTYPV